MLPVHSLGNLTEFTSHVEQALSLKLTGRFGVDRVVPPDSVRSLLGSGSDDRDPEPPAPLRASTEATGCQGRGLAELPPGLGHAFQAEARYWRTAPFPSLGAEQLVTVRGWICELPGGRMAWADTAEVREPVRGRYTSEATIRRMLSSAAAAVVDSIR